MTQAVGYIALTDRVSFYYVEKGYLEVEGHAVVVRQGNKLVHLPIGAACAVLVMPGVVVTHEAVCACAEEGTLLFWVGENGVRCYAAGNPGGAAPESLLRQAALRLDERRRLIVARKIFSMMFGEKAPEGRSVDQLRGMEGARVRELYLRMAKETGVVWQGREGFKGPLNQAISGANAALYSLTEAVVLALGYSPSIGFVHSGSPRSFVYDVADCIKFKTVVPMAMRLVKDSELDIEGRVRRACRDSFRSERVTNTLIDIVKELMCDV